MNSGWIVAHEYEYVINYVPNQRSWIIEATVNTGLGIGFQSRKCWFSRLIMLFESCTIFFTSANAFCFVYRFCLSLLLYRKSIVSKHSNLCQQTQHYWTHNCHICLFQLLVSSFKSCKSHWDFRREKEIMGVKVCLSPLCTLIFIKLFNICLFHTYFMCL